MVEIFTSPAGGQGAVTGQIADSIALEVPSDIYFGPAVPGIAFYEKSGANLAVTLLDGESVTLRNFFVIGQNGEYSRLLLGPGGEAELTGLVAPEPFVPPTDEPVVVAEVQPPAEITPPQESAPPQEMAAAPAPVPVQAETTAEAAPAAESTQGGFFGFNPEHLLFAAANVPILIALGSSNDDDDPDRNTPAQAAMDPETAEMVEGILAAEPTVSDESTATVLAQGDEAAPMMGDASFLLLDDLSAPIDPV